MQSVIIYTTPSCVYCKMAKSFFELNKVQYTEKDVAVDLQAQQEMIEKSGQLGVPVIDVSGKIIIGFDKGKLKELLNIQ